MQSAIVNAITLGLVDAGVEMKDYLISLNCGLLGRFQKLPVLDMNYAEEKSSKCLFILGVMCSSQEILFIESEKSKTHFENVKSLISRCVEGILSIHK